MKKCYLAFQAKIFYETFVVLRQMISGKNGIVRYYVPYIVNGAFSAELALKSILTENEIVYQKEHNLLKLFFLLPKVYRDEIISRFILLYPTYNQENLSVDLVLLSDAFIDWRYSFEGNVAPMDTKFADSFITAIAKTLEAHYNVDYVECEDGGISEEEFDKLAAEERQVQYEKHLKRLGINNDLS